MQTCINKNLLDVVIRRGIKEGINSTDKLILFTIASYLHKNSECWPSYSTLAEECLLSRQCVVEHIMKLVDMGVLARRKCGQRNYYSINVGAFLNPETQKSYPQPMENTSQRSLPALVNVDDSTSQRRLPDIYKDKHINRVKHSPPVHNFEKLKDFKPNAESISLCSRLGLSLTDQIDRFVHRHTGRGDLQYEFKRWLSTDKTITQKPAIRSTVKEFDTRQYRVPINRESGIAHVKELLNILRH